MVHVSAARLGHIFEDLRLKRLIFPYNVDSDKYIIVEFCIYYSLTKHLVNLNISMKYRSYLLGIFILRDHPFDFYGGQKD